ncbi:MAG: MoaD/ThiS family protein [Bacteroidota bacterium]|jgi:molybdopterin converting factor small subunit
MATVLIFGELKDITQTRAIEALPAMTVKSMRDTLAERWPDLEGKIYLVAINQKMASDDDLISDDAEVALMPPFSGG